MDFNINHIKLIVGLGNVGNEYAQTRHNAGFIFIDRLSNFWDELLGWKEEPKLHSLLKRSRALLAKPTTLMNRSGQAVNLISNYYQVQPEEVLVIHDDLDLEIGNYKLQFGRGPKQHNGIVSVEDYLDTEEFWRLRIGIENRDEDSQIPGKAYVLQKFTHEEQEELITMTDHIIKEYFNILSRIQSHHPLSS